MECAYVNHLLEESNVKLHAAKEDGEKIVKTNAAVVMVSANKD